MKNKKAQMEIMGLAIIVVLLFLGMVFVVKFIVLKEPKEYKKEYTHTELASNVIGAMLYTTAEHCSKVTFAKLFQDCAAHGGTAGDGSIDCGGPKSCTYVKQTANEILKDTLGKLHIKYHFRVEGTNENEIIGFIDTINFPDNNRCPPRSDVKQKRYPLPGATTIYVILDICE